MNKHAENALQHSLDKCERRLEAAERELAAYENLQVRAETAEAFIRAMDMSYRYEEFRDRLDQEGKP